MNYINSIPDYAKYAVVGGAVGTVAGALVGPSALHGFVITAIGAAAYKALDNLAASLARSYPAYRAHINLTKNILQYTVAAVACVALGYFNPVGAAIFIGTLIAVRHLDDIKGMGNALIARFDPRASRVVHEAQG